MSDTLDALSAELIKAKEAKIRGSWKCHNGDTLSDLNDRRSLADSKLSQAMQALMLAEQALRPLEDDVNRWRGECDNIACRLNIWWNEYRGAIKNRHGES